MAVRFYEQEVRARLKDRRRLSQYLQTLIRGLRPGTKGMQMTYIFCGDAYLLEINQQFLNHDTLTDIITFDLSEEEEQLEAEVYISTERVAENAEKFGVSYEQELHRVIFHGALHLCGFKDKTRPDRERMRAAEDRCLQEYFGSGLATNKA